MFGWWKKEKEQATDADKKKHLITLGFSEALANQLVSRGIKIPKDYVEHYDELVVMQKNMNTWESLKQSFLQHGGTEEEFNSLWSWYHYCNWVEIPVTFPWISNKDEWTNIDDWNTKHIKRDERNVPIR